MADSAESVSPLKNCGNYIHAEQDPANREAHRVANAHCTRLLDGVIHEEFPS
jgi:hypothetical protein